MIAQDPPSFSKSSLPEKRTHQDFNGESGSGSRSGGGNVRNSKNNGTKLSKRLYRGNAPNVSSHDDTSFQKNQIDENSSNQSSESSQIETSKVRLSISLSFYITYTEIFFLFDFQIKLN